MAGMGFVDVVFHSASQLAAGRVDISRRVEQVRHLLPPAARVQVGPEASSTGWVLEYVIADPTHRIDPVELRRLQDDVLRGPLASVPGVAEVASVGGASEELVVDARPDRLRAAGVAFEDLLSTLRAALAGHHVETLQDIAALPLAGQASRAPILVGDVAQVHAAGSMGNGAADYDGVVPAVGGIVIARRDADVSAVIARVNDVLERQRRKLPPVV
jgi:Cu(I)/Ag(I) efflux system membrane protein CusA/SilA